MAPLVYLIGLTPPLETGAALVLLGIMAQALVTSIDTALEPNALATLFASNTSIAFLAATALYNAVGPSP